LQITIVYNEIGVAVCGIFTAIETMQAKKLSLLHCYSAWLIAIALGAVAVPCLAESEPPFTLPPRVELLKLRSAIIETSRGSLYFELLPEEAPWHVANFKYLADKKFYQGLQFHLFEPGYLIQGGDPKGTGHGGPGYSLQPEFSPRNHKFGTLGMARKPDAYNRKKQLVNPERRSNGSQFHILLSDAPHMDGRYTIFGKLVGGSSVLSELRRSDTIKNVTVFVRQGGR
jgi:peptidyl-prolyl cis-trans isomerase B (cyclophilin B)